VDEEEKKIDFSHNPFSMRIIRSRTSSRSIPRIQDKILAIKAIQYDIVCNGIGIVLRRRSAIIAPM